MQKPDQEPAYTMLFGMIECVCGGWHNIKTFWTGSEQHGWECHTSVIHCQGKSPHTGRPCNKTIGCNVCKQADYCTIHGLGEQSDPTQTEMRTL